MGCSGSTASAPKSASKPTAENTLLHVGIPSPSQKVPAVQADKPLEAEADRVADTEADKDSGAKDAGPMLMDANALMEGELVFCRSNGQEGVVLKRTTTDVLLQHTDGTEVWHEAEDVGQPAMFAAAYNVREDEVVVVGSALGTVVQRTTTDVHLRRDDGSEAWHAVEDVAQLLPQAYGVKKGDEVVRLADGARGTVQERTTADVLLGMADGTEQWHGLEDVARATAPAFSSAPSASEDTQTTTDMATQALQGMSWPEEAEKTEEEAMEEAEKTKEQAVEETKTKDEAVIEEAPRQRRERQLGCC